ncbi:MAG: thioesterase [Spirochaetes bacterium]|nr:thioesterase [Spirochaetota bacterium]
MAIVKPHRVEYTVRGFDCGYGGPFRAMTLTNWLQEAAGEHAAALGLGVGRLMESGMTWMISKTDIRVDALPVSGDRVVVETWPAGLDRLFALRCFRMLGTDGNVLVRAVYAYLVVDVAARRPVRPERVVPVDLRCDEPSPVPDLDFSVPPMGARSPSFSQRARPRHVDHNGHVNNAHLVDWLVDAASAAAARGSDEPALRELKVEFRAEVLPGDELTACSSEIVDGRVVTELRRGDTAVARAGIVFA